MNFKRIELVGFKSFAEKTVVNFDGGITAIVGPNGCGKSNVADAIRWVLGEQSSKLLRGSSMQDVIFNGTQNRKSLSYCEVSLVLDNSNRDLDIDYNEIILTRKLYRSGESEYLINKNTSRLKDIVDILHDSGIGKDGYSIIGQGKVEEIVSSKPENRRSIFEEAAGIAKFKAKKLESERKLERTRDNLSRLRDILIEIERQLNPLKEQAEIAKQYLQLKEELKLLEVNNYIYQYDSASDNKKEIQIRIDALNEELTSKQDDLDVTIKKYNDNYNDIQKIDLTIKDLYDKVVSLTVSLERKSGETGILKERLVLLKEEASRLNSELSKTQQNLSDIEITIKNKIEKKAINEKEIERLISINNTINENYLNIVDELAVSEDKAEENQQAMISALDSLSDIKADISRLNAEKNASLEKSAEITNSLNVLNNKMQSQLTEKNKLSAEVIAMSNTLDLKKKNFENEKAKELQLNVNINENNNKFLEINSAISSHSARVKLLEDMKKNYDGFNGAVKHILRESEKNNALKSNFIGVVANLIKVPAEYKTAIEMALGNAIQNVVTENEENAEKIITYLKERGYGRATFLPVTALKPRRLTGFESFINSKGCFGVASKLIEFDGKLSNIFENLLGGTVIVDNLVTAINLAKQSRYGFKIVTLDGDIINPQGSLTGGSKTANSVSVIGRESELEELNKQIPKLLESKQLISNILQEDKQKLVLLQQNQQILNGEINNISIELGKRNEILNQYETYLNEQNTEKVRLEKNLSDLKVKISAIDLNLSEFDKKQSNINSNKSVANESIQKLQQNFENLKKERDEYNEKVLNIKVNIAEIQTENNSIEDDIIRLNQEQENCLQSLESLNGFILSNSETVKKAEQVINAKMQDTEYAETNKQLTDVKAKLDGLSEHKNSLQKQLKELDEDRLNLTTKINKLQDKHFQENMNLTKVDTDIENMQERIWNEYSLNYSSCLDMKRENYNLVEGLQQANKTKREIDKLGFVNVNAIEDSKIYQERFDEYNVQIQDLSKAEEDLTKIIKELALEMTNRFTSSFEQVNENFGKVFKELFGGGNARLELVESESGDVLDAGVDIKAEPPGKKLQSITLLSGGEKALTAIAILFAILKLRPMPFVLLDEIEAALDDANVGRFAKYLKKFSSETQFIVITHRKPTMELADNLYGVTMPEKGVSSIVSVKLSESVQYAK